MTANNDRIIGRIKKMLNLANDAGATEGERDNALRMAYATLAKHNIEMAQVEGHELNSKKKEDEKREQVDKDYTAHHWARVVSMAIAELFFCTYFYSRNRYSGKVRHSFVGRTANAVTASEMAAYLCKSISREAARQAKGHYAPGAAQRDFCKGAVNKITRRCYSMRREAEEAAAPATPAAQPGMALVLKNLYALEVTANKQFLEKAGVTFGKAVSGRSASHHDAYAKGAEYGSTVSLDRQVGKQS